MSFDFVLDHRALLAGVGAAATFAMVGVIWIVQLVHYPSFAFVDATRYAEFQNFHERNITFIVLPLMLVEALCAFALLASAAMGTQVDGDSVGTEMFTPSAIGLGLVVFLWGWTALVSVPFHARLAGGSSVLGCFGFPSPHDLEFRLLEINGLVVDALDPVDRYPVMLAVAGVAAVELDHVSFVEMVDRADVLA